MAQDNVNNSRKPRFVANNWNPDTYGPDPPIRQNDEITAGGLLFTFYNNKDMTRTLCKQFDT